MEQLEKKGKDMREERPLILLRKRVYEYCAYPSHFMLLYSSIVLRSCMSHFVFIVL